MTEIIEGKWEDLLIREDLRGRRVRVIVLDDAQSNPWIKSLRAWADSHKGLRHRVDDSRESIYSGTLDDTR